MFGRFECLGKYSESTYRVFLFFSSSMAPEMTRRFFLCVQFPRSELQDVSSGDVRRYGRDVWNSRTVLWTGITTVHGPELLFLQQCLRMKIFTSARALESKAPA